MYLNVIVRRDKIHARCAINRKNFAKFKRNISLVTRESLGRHTRVTRKSLAKRF